MSFFTFINNKPLFYKKIDINRIKFAYMKLSKCLDINLGRVIHIVGTNGKGSTGSFISRYLNSLSYKVAHYTSPHIFLFNERISIFNQDITNENIELCHKELYDILGEDMSNSLSYFEYTTLLMVVAFNKSNLDYAIIEAGMGGEFDATNVISKYISVITPISKDHEDFLGKNIEDIAMTKLKSIDSRACIGEQSDLVKELIDIKFKNKDILYAKERISNNKLIEISKLNIPNFQKENITLAISVLNYIGVENIDLFKLSKFTPKYRFFYFKNNVIIDVGHNIASAQSILKEFNKKIILIYNTYQDKDYKSIMRTLSPILKEVLILDIKNNSRMEDTDKLIDFIRSLTIKTNKFNNLILSKEIYLVYGSFVVAENFMNQKLQVI